MNTTYKRECFISNRSDLGGFVAMGVWACAALACFLSGLYLIFVKERHASFNFALGGVFLLIAAFVVVNQLRDIQKRRKRALDMRYRAMNEGVRCGGVIVDAGMAYESVAYDWEDEDGRPETRYRREPGYWIDVDYRDPETREDKRFRAEHINRSMERLIGRGVDVYVWHEWSEYIHKDLTLTYVDTYSVN